MTGPETVLMNKIFQILIRLTNLTKSTKTFSLGIDENMNNDDSGLNRKFIPLEVITKLRSIVYIFVLIYVGINKF
jgi:hypothetical protein